MFFWNKFPHGNLNNINLQWLITQVKRNLNSITELREEVDAIDVGGGYITISVKESPYSAKGDGESDDTLPIQNAIDYVHEQGGGRVDFPVGTYLITSTISVPNDVSLQGVDMNNTTIMKNGSFVGIVTEGPFMKELTVDSQGVDIEDGIVLTGGNRKVLNRVRSQNHGGNGIDYQKGNLSIFTTVYCLFNGGHGLLCNNATIDNNAATFINLDLRSNGGDGLHITDDLTGYASLSHFGLGIIAQENGGYGVYVGTRNNHLSVYAEANTAGQTYLSATARANYITSVEGGVEVVDTANGNQVLNGNQGGDYKAAYNRIRSNIIECNNDDIVGYVESYQDTDRKQRNTAKGTSSSFETIFDHGQGSTHNVRLTGNLVVENENLTINAATIRVGTGSPIGSVSLPTGSIYIDVSASDNDVFWFQRGNTVNTWKRINEFV